VVAASATMPCYNLLYGFKAAPRGRSRPPPRRPGRHSRWRSRDGRANAGRLARRAEEFGAAIDRESS
jgi:hypothetical protein